MREFTELKENQHGGMDAIYNGQPYTLTAEENAAIDATDPSIIWLSDEAKAATAAEQSRVSAKAVRDVALNSLTYTFEDGRELQTRPQDGQNIQTAISLGESIEFVCLDNTVSMFTVLELQEAMTAGVVQAKAVWSTYIESIR